MTTVSACRVLDPQLLPEDRSRAGEVHLELALDPGAARRAVAAVAAPALALAVRFTAAVRG